VHDGEVSDDHRRLWAEVERRLRALGLRLAGSLSEDQTKWYGEFLDANELGLALEMLADWLSERETPIREADRTEMLALGRAMGNEQRVEDPLRLCPPVL
jgi:predicted Zn-dependent peptidase